MRLYSAFDLHSSSSYLGIIDENGKRVLRRKLQNDEGLMVKVLNPFKGDIARRVYLSERGSTDTGSSEEEKPSGEDTDVAHCKPAEHLEQKPGWQDEDE